MTHESPFENGAPDHDVKIANTSGVLGTSTEGGVTGKRAKFLDLRDNELSEHLVQTFAK
jgi:hypothetical protein